MNPVYLPHPAVPLSSSAKPQWPHGWLGTCQHLWSRLGCRQALLASAAVATSALLLGCSSIPDKSFYCEKLSNEVSKNEADKQSARKKIVVVEFDEMGCQRPAWEAKSALKAIDCFKPDTLLVYAHGWNNNGDPASIDKKDEDLNDIDGLLNKLTETNPQKKVLAIYLAWRGKSINGPAWKGLLTLNARRDVAGVIGRSPSLHSFLGNVAAAGRKKKGTSIIFSGHSLGAALMEKAAVAMLVPKCGRPILFERLPHLFLLVNTAERARVSAKSHRDITNAIAEATVKQDQAAATDLLVPKVLSVTSRGDMLNHFAQPLNNFLLRPDRFFVDLLFLYPPWAVGFNRKALTHTIEETPQVSEPAPPIKGAKPMNRKEIDIERSQRLLNLSSKPRVDPSFWAPEGEGSLLRKWCVEPKTHSPGARLPGFWSFQITKAVGNGHSDVYNEKFMGAFMSWFHMANPALTKATTDALGKQVVPLPKRMDQLLHALKIEIASAPALSKFTQQPQTPKAIQDEATRQRRSDFILGAAARMPHTAAALRLVLDELANLQPSPARLEDDALLTYRAYLFHILKRTYKSPMWNEPCGPCQTCGPRSMKARMRTLLQEKDIQYALDVCECKNLGGRYLVLGTRYKDFFIREFREFLSYPGPLPEPSASHCRSQDDAG